MSPEKTVPAETFQKTFSFMRNLKLTIEYDGTDYAGWQIQNSRKCCAVVSRQLKTIQGVIEKTLKHILQERIFLIGSGRTDAGVHALAQVANFKTRSHLPADKLQKALNALLPDDIAVSKVEEAELDFHSRFSVRSKVYRYTILNRAYCSPFLKTNAYFYPHPLNIRLMQKAARALLGRHNFSAFQNSGSFKTNPARLIKKIKIARQDNFVYIDIEAEGFLYRMARNIVGTLISVGRKKLAVPGLKKIILSQDRRSAGPAAPAHGLCLIKVNY